MKTEIINGLKIKVYDKQSVNDRYSIALMNKKYENDLYMCLGMNGIPEHQTFGIGQSSFCRLGKHIGKRISFDSLPDNVKKYAMSYLFDEN